MAEKIDWEKMKKGLSLSLGFASEVVEHYFGSVDTSKKEFEDGIISKEEFEERKGFRLDTYKVLISKLFDIDIKDAVEKVDGE